MFTVFNRMTRRWSRRAAIAAVAAALLAAPQILCPADAFAMAGARQISVTYSNIKIKVDGAAIIPKDATGAVVHPFLYNGATYIPVRALSNALGCDVSWNGAAAAVTIRSNGSGKPEYGVAAGKTGAQQISVTYDDIVLVVDGKKAALSSEPFSYDGTVYLPLRAAANALGCAVDYEDATKTVLITRGGAPGAGSTPDAVTAGVFSKADFSFVVPGGAVALDENASGILKTLGAGYAYEEAVSCAYVGMDKIYRYDGIEISTLPIGSNGGDAVCSVDVSVNLYRTSKSVTVGSTLSQIETAYGKDYTMDFGTLIYWDGEKDNPRTPQLYFELDSGNLVTAFGMYNGKSAG